MSYNAVMNKFCNCEKYASNYLATSNRTKVTERLLNLPVCSYADNDEVHAAIQTDQFKQNWLEFQIWSLRQIQLHADELLAESDDLDDSRVKMINELKAHAAKFTVDDVKHYQEPLTDFYECPLAESEIVLGDSGLDGRDVASILNFVGDLVRNPNHVEVNFS